MSVYDVSVAYQLAAEEVPDGDMSGEGGGLVSGSDKSGAFTVNMDAAGADYFGKFSYQAPENLHFFSSLCSSHEFSLCG